MKTARLPKMRAARPSSRVVPQLRLLIGFCGYTRGGSEAEAELLAQQIRKTTDYKATVEQTTFEDKPIWFVKALEEKKS